MHPPHKFLKLFFNMVCLMVTLFSLPGPNPGLGSQKTHNQRNQACYRESAHLATHRLHCCLCRGCPPLHGPGIGSWLTAPHLRPWRSGDMVVTSWLGPPSWPPPSPHHVPPGAGTSVSGLLTGPQAPPSRCERRLAVCPPVTPLSRGGERAGVWGGPLTILGPQVLPL